MWAVGIGSQTLIVHWNGKVWKRVPSPNLPGNYLNVLFGVVATSAGNAWAVGTSSCNQVLVERWNGAAWK